MITCIAAYVSIDSIAVAFDAHLRWPLYLQCHRAGPTSGASSNLNAVKDADALGLYFWGTALARSALGFRFLPPHYLKLSQFFKSHGVGAIAKRLLSAMDLCCGDTSRWRAEQAAVSRFQEKKLI